jgi:hypothetical protein
LLNCVTALIAELLLSMARANYPNYLFVSNLLWNALILFDSFPTLGFLFSNCSIDMYFSLTAMYRKLPTSIRDPNAISINLAFSFSENRLVPSAIFALTEVLALRYLTDHSKLFLIRKSLC